MAVTTKQIDDPVYTHVVFDTYVDAMRGDQSGTSRVCSIHKSFDEAQAALKRGRGVDVPGAGVRYTVIDLDQRVPVFGRHRNSTIGPLYREYLRSECK